jgi:hypothetical protein
MSQTGEKPKVGPDLSMWRFRPALAGRLVLQRKRVYPGTFYAGQPSHIRWEDAGVEDLRLFYHGEDSEQ